MQKRHGDGADAGCRQSARGARDRFLVERHLLASVPAHPPRDAVAPVAGNQHRLRRGFQRIGLAAHMAADLQHIGEPLVGDHRAFRQLALQHGIGGDGGAVQDEPDLARLEMEAFRRLGNACEQPLGRVCRRGRGLQRVDRAGLRIQNHQVREGAADIHTDAVACSRFRHTSL